MTTQTRLSLTACDGCGQQIPGLDPGLAGQHTLALCADCNHGVAVCGGGIGIEGWAWSVAHVYECPNREDKDGCEGGCAATIARYQVPTCDWCGWDETDSEPHQEDCGR